MLPNIEAAMNRANQIDVIFNLSVLVVELILIQLMILAERSDHTVPSMSKRPKVSARLQHTV